MSTIAESIKLHTEHLGWLLKRDGGLLDRLAKYPPRDAMSDSDLANAERQLRELADTLAKKRGVS